MKLPFGGRIGWNFPDNGGGQQNGPKDQGIEHFNNRPLTSLAREIVQNSLDAAGVDRLKAVEIHFQLHLVKAPDLPDLAELSKALDACREFWPGAEGAVFFEQARDLCKDTSIRVLKVSDYNTTGLSLPTKKEQKSDWHRLTKEVGASGKHAGKLGSFGIGKNAPFACSGLRTVFYGTLDTNGARAFQGVARLASHKRPDGKIAQGVGYWGIREGSEPKKDFSKLADIFHRDQIGTDLYVIGFQNSADWENEITKSILESFFFAIWDGKLQVKIGKTIVNKASMKKLFAKLYAERDKRYYADEYYRVLTDEKAAEYSEADFMGCGKVRLLLLEEKDLKNRIAMFRLSGMKIFDKRHRQPSIHFAGVFRAEGLKLDALLRQLEPPSHDSWQAERTAPPEALKILKELLAWVGDKVKQLRVPDDGTELDAAGMSEFLPDETEDAKSGALDDSEEIEQAPAANLTMLLRSPSRAAMQSDQQAGGSEDVGEQEDPQGSLDLISGDGVGDDNDDEPQVEAGPEPGRRVELESIRSFCVSPREGRYRLLLSPAVSEAVWMKVSIIGEVGAEPARIARCKLNDGPELAAKSGRLIGPFSLVKEQRAVLEIVLAEPIRCALEVAAYAS